jgi:hypothetical protein
MRASSCRFALGCPYDPMMRIAFISFEHAGVRHGGDIGTYIRSPAAMKARHRIGARIRAFAAALEAVTAMHAWTHPAARREAMYLAAVCQLNGGTLKDSLRSMNSAKNADAMGLPAFLEALACVWAWPRVGNSIPTLAYMNRRGMLSGTE